MRGEGGGGGRGGTVSYLISSLQEEVQEDATELIQFVPYHWRDWFFLRSPELLLVWNEYCALELSAVSNGWFRYLMDGKVATMYSSGSAESGPDPFEPRAEFVEKMQQCCSQVRTGSVPRPLLSSPTPHRLVVGNWSLISQREGEVAIHNSEGIKVRREQHEFNTYTTTMNMYMYMYMYIHM